MNVSDRTQCEGMRRIYTISVAWTVSVSCDVEGYINWMSHQLGRLFLTESVNIREDFFSMMRRFSNILIFWLSGVVIHWNDYKVIVFPWSVYLKRKGSFTFTHLKSFQKTLNNQTWTNASFFSSIIRIINILISGMIMRVRNMILL